VGVWNRGAWVGDFKAGLRKACGKVAGKLDERGGKVHWERKGPLVRTDGVHVKGDSRGRKKGKTKEGMVGGCFTSPRTKRMK